MRSMVLAAVMTSYIAFSASGCSTGTAPNLGSGGGGEGGGGSGGGETTGGMGGVGGQGGQGGGGGPTCMPQTEQCDGMDNDCDGQVDEDCACTNGQTQSCYSGPMNTQGQGICASGQQTCDLKGTWGPCMGEVLPAVETCNTIDDDCNGAIDDMGMTSCGVGACQVTVLQCENGQLNTCTPGSPSVEVCDGIDNDCDQLTDETYPGKGMSCNTGMQGACNIGQTDCVMGAPVCIPAVMPKMEVCNNIDDDCNGVADDNIPGTGTVCGTGLPGVCNQGTYSCKFNALDCWPDTPSSAEKCNGLDDDCDGMIDDGDPEGGATCMTGIPGVCAAGVIHCGNGTLNCIPNATASMETCNGIDDNCDGQIDENNPGGGVACGCGGTLQCQSGALKCVGGPTTYFSDGFANNNAGWTLDTEWQIGPALAGCGDPGTDTTNTADNGIAGVVLGGCMSVASLHPYYYLTSPVINTANAPTVFLQFQRLLDTDYTPYVNNTVEVYNGSTWVVVWQSGTIGGNDTAWTKVSYDISIHKNANMRIRFGHNVGSSFAFTGGGWNIDDVLVADAACP